MRSVIFPNHINSNRRIKRSSNGRGRFFVNSRLKRRFLVRLFLEYGGYFGSQNSNIGYTLAIIIRYVWQRPRALTDHLQSGSIKKQVGKPANDLLVNRRWSIGGMNDGKIDISNLTRDYGNGKGILTCHFLWKQERLVFWVLMALGRPQRSVI